MITLNQQTEDQRLSNQPNRTTVCESFILDYQDEQDSIKRADQSYAERVGCADV